MDLKREARNDALPLRIQRWGTEWPDIAPEVLLQEYEFTDFNAEFPDSTFAFTPTDADLAPLGITAAQLGQLPARPFPSASWEPRGPR